MMRLNSGLALAAATLALAGCATTSRGGSGGPTEVTRYHLGQPLPTGSVTVESAPGGPGGLEFATYGDAVAGQLSRLGFAPAPADGASQYIASVSFVRTPRGTVRTPPKFSIGIGGGSFGGGGRRGGGGGVGLGGDVSTGFGSKTLSIYAVELFVQLRRRGDGTVVWEGRAQRPETSGASDISGRESADRLAAALFRDFPGESGITTTVR